MNGEKQHGEQAAQALELFAREASWIYASGNFKGRRRELRLTFQNEFKVLYFAGRGAARTVYLGKDAASAAAAYNECFEGNIREK